MRKKDYFLNSLTIFSASLGVVILALIIGFVIKNGISALNFKILVSDYQEKTYSVSLKDNQAGLFENNGHEFFSKNWGIAICDTTNLEGQNVVGISYIDEQSPFKHLVNLNSDEIIDLQGTLIISKIILTNENNDYIMSFSKDGAKNVLENLEKGTVITDMILVVGGGGIRGSLLTTLYLVLLTLVIALPVGVSSAIYLTIYSPNNRFTKIIQQMIDATSGIPSIIFGFVGAMIFIPIMNRLISSSGGSIAAGALTLSIILLPVITKTTSESLKAIPDSYMMGSIALGTSKTQAAFKIILPNAIPGILTATFLSIGRIIGESAALIYVMGTYISDNIAINKPSTSLAVHIWSLMAGEVPNYKLSCAIAIIILIIVLLLSILVNIISKKLNRMEPTINKSRDIWKNIS